MAEPTDKILDCLNRIRAEQDPTLAFRASCAHGICGSDALMINGKVALACQKLVKDFKTANNFVIEPLPLFKVLKDLIVDLDPFFEKHRQVRPFLINTGEAPESERLQAPEAAAGLRPGPALHPVRLLHGLLSHQPGQPGVSRVRRRCCGRSAIFLTAAIPIPPPAWRRSTRRMAPGAARPCGGARMSAPKGFRSPSAWARSSGR